MTLARMQHLLPTILSKAKNHQFNQELVKGTLPRDVFRTFIIQDSFYLRDFSIALQRTSARLKNPVHAKQFRQFAEETIETERDLHKKYLGNHQSQYFFSIKNQPKKIPVVADYTHFLLQSSTSAPVEEAVASLAPCFWLYGELGMTMQPINMNTAHPYHNWIASYSNPAFIAAANSMMQITNELSAALTCPIQHENMLLAFLKSADFEVKFWDSVIDGDDNRLKNNNNHGPT